MLFGPRRFNNTTFPHRAPWRDESSRAYVPFTLEEHEEFENSADIDVDVATGSLLFYVKVIRGPSQGVGAPEPDDVVTLHHTASERELAETMEEVAGKIQEMAAAVCRVRGTSRSHRTDAPLARG